MSNKSKKSVAVVAAPVVPVATPVVPQVLVSVPVPKKVPSTSTSRGVAYHAMQASIGQPRSQVLAAIALAESNWRATSKIAKQGRVTNPSRRIALWGGVFN